MVPSIYGSLAWMVFSASVPLLVNRFYIQDKVEDREAAVYEMSNDHGLPINETYDFIIGEILVTFLRAAETI